MFNLLKKESREENGNIFVNTISYRGKRVHLINLFKKIMFNLLEKKCGRDRDIFVNTVFFRGKRLNFINLFKKIIFNLLKK